MYMASLGYGFTRWQVIDMDKEMLPPGEIGNPPCIGSMVFRQRFPELKMITQIRETISHMTPVNDGVLANYFA